MTQQIDESEFVPPSDTASEVQLLSAMLVDTSLIDAAASAIDADEFYDSRNRIIFRAMVSTWQQRRMLDGVILRDSIKADPAGASLDFEEIEILLQSGGFGFNLAYYAHKIRSTARLRQLSRIGLDIHQSTRDKSETPESILARAEKAFSQIRTGHYNTEPVTLAQATLDCQLFMDQAEESRGGGIQTGLPMLDDTTGGVFQDELVLIGARSGVGKTSFALQIAHTMAAAGKCVYFGSLETNRVQIALKNLCRLSSVPIRMARMGKLFQGQRDRINDAVSQCDLPLHIHDWPKIRPYDIARSARKVKASFVIVVDYLQAREAHTDSTQEAFGGKSGQISDELKTAAGDLHVPVIALAQLNREVDKQGKESRQRSCRIFVSPEISNRTPIKFGFCGGQRVASKAQANTPAINGMPN